MWSDFEMSPDADGPASNVLSTMLDNQLARTRAVNGGGGGGVQIIGKAAKFKICPCCEKPAKGSKKHCDDHNQALDNIRRCATAGSSPDNPTQEHKKCTEGDNLLVDMQEPVNLAGKLRIESLVVVFFLECSLAPAVFLNVLFDTFRVRYFVIVF